MIEIRWHGRGGQGAKTASLLLADMAFALGMCVQGFPEYGPERMGAPITAYNRLDSKAITIHSNIYTPNIVVVVDESLIEAADITAGIQPGGAVIVNSRSQEAIKKSLLGFSGKVYMIDARAISERYLGRDLPNTPLLSATVKVAGIAGKDAFLRIMQDSFAHKFATKPEAVCGNMQAIERAWEEVIEL